MRKGISSRYFLREEFKRNVSTNGVLFLLLLLVLLLLLLLLLPLLLLLLRLLFLLLFIERIAPFTRAKKKRKENMSRRFFVHLPRLWVALAFTMSSKEQKAIRGRTKVQLESITMRRSFGSIFCFGVSFLFVTNPLSHTFLLFLPPSTTLLPPVHFFLFLILLFRSEERTLSFLAIKPLFFHLESHLLNALEMDNDGALP